MAFFNTVYNVIAYCKNSTNSKIIGPKIEQATNSTKKICTDKAREREKERERESNPYKTTSCCFSGGKSSGSIKANS